MQRAGKDHFEKARNFYRKYGKNHLQNGHKRCIIYNGRDSQMLSRWTGIFCPLCGFCAAGEKYVAFIAACPSQHDKLSRSNEEAISLSKEDVIEIEGIVREAMPNAIFKVEM